MELILTLAEKARLAKYKNLSYEEDCSGACNGYLRIDFSGIGEAATFVYKTRRGETKSVLINVEDCDNA